MYGEIYQINVGSKSDENGLPKIVAESAFLLKEGFEGDFNHFRKRKYSEGKFSREKFLERAVSIYTRGMISILKMEGYIVREGDFGENLNVEGIDHDEFEIGMRFVVGDDALIQISSLITPCVKLRTLPYFEEVDAVKLLLNRRGWYARVLKEGLIKKGDSLREI